MEIRLASWNVNGIRAAPGKDGIKQWISEDRYDVIGLQEKKNEKTKQNKRKERKNSNKNK